MNAFYEGLLDKVSVRTLRLTTTLILVAVTLLGVYAWGHDWILTAWSTPPRFGGDEIAEWHLLPGGQVRVHSRISITHCPQNATFMRIELPYESAKIESATLDNRPISWHTIPPGVELEPGLYLTVNTPGPALKQSLLEVVWSFSFEQEVPKEENYYKMKFGGLIPVKAYAPILLLEPGCGFEVTGHPELRVQQPMGLRQHNYSWLSGTCSLLIQHTNDN